MGGVLVRTFWAFFLFDDVLVLLGSFWGTTSFGFK